MWLVGCEQDGPTVSGVLWSSCGVVRTRSSIGPKTGLWLLTYTMFPILSWHAGRYSAITPAVTYSIEPDSLRQTSVYRPPFLGSISECSTPHHAFRCSCFKKTSNTS